RRRHTRFSRDWSSDVCSSDLDFESVTGKGVVGKVNGKNIGLGNTALINRYEVEYDDKIENAVISVQRKGKTVSVLFVENRVVGYVIISDAIKKTSKEAIAMLKKDGVEVLMLTGDNKNTAQTVADELNLSSFIAEC